MSEVLQTIAAVATPRGEGGISIVRISGTMALPILRQVFSPVQRDCRFKSRRLYLGHVVDQGGVRVDQVLAVYMRGPQTYTGEDVVEIHTHGGLFVTGETLRLVLQAGARLANPGEFTQRAFLSGKLDLVQAEAVIDLIRAAAGAAAKQAERHLDGELSATVRSIQAEVMALLSAVAAAVDFPDEDIPELQPSLAVDKLNQLQQQLEQLLATSVVGKVLRDGIKVVIAGRPNVGKSSLLNRLLGSEKAIVTEYAGTTRDIVEDYVSIGGVPVKLMDTAGVHAAVDPVEQIGVTRAQQAMATADLILVVLDRSQTLTDEDFRVMQLAEGRPHLVVWNKVDVPAADGFLQQTFQYPGLAVSAVSGEGLDRLKSEMVQRVIGDHSIEDSLLVANARQEEALRGALSALQDAGRTVAEGWPTDMLAVDLERALHQLGSVLGETTDGAVIDDIFARFCIGK